MGSKARLFAPLCHRSIEDLVPHPNFYRHLIAKLILDSLKGVLIHDDDEIVRCLAQKTVADPTGRYAYDPLLIPSTTVPTALADLLGAHDHVLYIEVGAVADPTVTFGPVS